LRILVTGANGFVGSGLCAYLEKEGHEVRRGVRVHDGLANTFEVSDDTSPDRIREALHGVECIVHLAARVHVQGGTGPVLETAYRETNVEFTKQLALIGHSVGVRRFVFVSSIKVCGEVSSRPFVEGDASSPMDSYAISKWEAEQALHEIEKECGIEVVIIRPPLIYGEGVKANFMKLLSAVRLGIPLPFSLLSNKRSLIYLGNLVSALSVSAVHPKAAGQTFHVSDNGSVTLPQLVNELAKAMEHKAWIFPCPKQLLIMGGAFLNKNQQVGSLVNDLEVGSDKIHQVLEWSPPYTFRQGIQKTAEWYLGKTATAYGRLKVAGFPKRPKVCQLCAVDFTLKHLLLPLVDGMQEKGWDVTSVCSDGKYLAELLRHGYKIHTISISRDIFNVSAHLKALWILYRLFRQERFDVLHVHTPVAALLGRIAGKLAGVPLIIYTAHGFYFHDEMPKWKYRFFVLLEKLCGRLTDLIFTQSSEDAYFSVVSGISEKKNTIAIGNGVSVELFDPVCAAKKSQIRTALGIPENACVVGVISRLVREKGLVEFLEAAVELSGRFPVVHFLLVGERLSSDHDASVEQELHNAQKQLRSRLVAVGYRSDVADMLGAMDIFCLPSYREGMPRSIIEAMMMELPVVATNIRGSREEVVDEETGLLVPTHSSAALAQALGRLIEDPDLARRMGRLGRQRALELYDERRVIARQIETIATRMVAV